MGFVMTSLEELKLILKSTNFNIMEELEDSFLIHYRDININLTQVAT